MKGSTKSYDVAQNGRRAMGTEQGAMPVVLPGVDSGGVLQLATSDSS